MGISITEAGSVINHGIVDTNERVGLAAVQFPSPRRIGCEHTTTDITVYTIVAHIRGIDGINLIMSIGNGICSSCLRQPERIGFESYFGS